MPALRLSYEVQRLRLAEPFRISGYVFDEAQVVVVTLDDGAHSGRGEASGVYYLEDDAEAMTSVLETHRSTIETAPTRGELLDLMAPGGARNAVDCALWELEARRSGKPVWALAGIPEPRPVVTTFTVSADDPERMAEAAIRYAQATAIKIKLTGEFDLDVARVSAIRAARPDAWLGVDANQGYTVAELDPLVAAMVEARVSLIEQPLARGLESDLDGYRSPIPIAADESVLGLDDVACMVGRFDIVNIKLDKCGGLTEGLAMEREARRLGLGVMVGNMIGSSLAIAPAFVLGQLVDVADLDGPIFLAQDRSPGVVYEAGRVWAGDEVWGVARGER